MIEEDYVSFETAKLLKEKGFDEICFTWYTGKSKFKQGKNTYDDYHMNHFPDMDVAKCSAPTLQTAMKWLREVHNLYIDIRININNSLYSFKIYSVGISGARAFTEYKIKSYEAACEAAIKYCFEHLI